MRWRELQVLSLVGIDYLVARWADGTAWTRIVCHSSSLTLVYMQNHYRENNYQ